MVVVIDNYDSFTYNLVQYIEELGAKTVTYRNDKVDLNQLKKLDISRIVISPGPGKPEDGGISCDVIKYFYQHIPILGVCLGHQCIGYVFGAKIVKANAIMHGKTSLIYHSGKDIFKGVKNPFVATRYHSLVIDPHTLSKELVVNAYTQEKTIMGIRHIKYKLFGVQFHPESILTVEGKKIIDNFLKI